MIRRRNKYKIKLYIIYWRRGRRRRKKETYGRYEKRNEYNCTYIFDNK